MFVDTHAHLYLEQFHDDIEMLVEIIKDSGVNHVYLPNIDSSSIDDLLSLSSAYPEMMHPMMGLHPCSVKENYKEELLLVKKYLSEGNFCAVGEIGIDLYWDKTFRKEQIMAFETQIEWARDFEIPFVIHSRDSLDETIEIVSKKQKGDLNGIFHCFNGTEEQGKKINDCGFFIGIGGVLTYKNSGVSQNIVNLPIEMMVLETDAPYLSPAPFRGKRNQSNYIPIIADYLAMIKEIEVVKVAKETTKNAFRLFGAPNLENN